MPTHPTLQHLRCMLIMALVAGAIAAIGAGPATAQQSGSCTTSGQPWGASYAWGPSGTVNVNQGVLIPYGGTSSLCYSLADTGSQSIGADKTHSRTFASSSYIPLGYCKYLSDTSYTTLAFAGTWGSGTATATNWNAKDNYHWALGAAFNEDVTGLFNATPTDDYSMVTADCTNDYGCPESQDIGCDGHRGPVHDVFDAAAGRRARTRPNPAALTPITRTFTAAGTYSMQCPHGQFIANADAATSAPAKGLLEGAYVDHGLRAARVHIVRLPTGETASAQLVCRPLVARLFANGDIQWGTSGDLDLVSKAAGQQIFAGAGDNVVTATHKAVIVQTGFGDDTATLNGRRSVAVGGVGDDALTDNSGSSILEGGLGSDTLTSNAGRTHINAVDGSGDDTIVCAAASKALVTMDEGDTVEGTCGSIRVLRGAHA